jgi:hypothetical protein
MSNSNNNENSDLEERKRETIESVLKAQPKIEGDEKIRKRNDTLKLLEQGAFNDWVILRKKELMNAGFSKEESELTASIEVSKAYRERDETNYSDTEAWRAIIHIEDQIVALPFIARFLIKKLNTRLNLVIILLGMIIILLLFR